MGIKETKDVLDFGFALVESYEKANEDGKFKWTDFSHFLDDFMKLPAAIKDIDQVDEELADLDEAEIQELIDTYLPKVNIEPEEKRQRIANLTKGVLVLAAAIMDMVEARKNVTE